MPRGESESEILLLVQGLAVFKVKTQKERGRFSIPEQASRHLSGTPEGIPSRTPVALIITMKGGTPVWCGPTETTSGKEIRMPQLRKYIAAYDWITVALTLNPTTHWHVQDRLEDG